MKFTMIFTASLLVLLVAALAGATPGIQVVGCEEIPPGSDQWFYEYFVCGGPFSANDLHIALSQEEIDQGSQIVGCSVPDMPGYTCAFDATTASYYFPTIGPFTCIPGEDGMWLGITILTPDGFTIVTESWTLDGVPVGVYGTSITCPPVPTEKSTWGVIKSMY